MKTGDFIICTFEGDTASPPTNYVAEITSVDTVNEFFSCRWVDDDGPATFRYSSNTSGPWYGDDGAGTDYVVETHDIYVPASQDPAAAYAAVVTFADNRRYLCYVESVSPTIDVVFYHSPYPRLSFDFNEVTASDWDLYPAGGQILSIERCILQNEIAAPVDHGVFDSGWWSLAVRRSAHPGRVGGNINPFSVVVHTTDVVPEGWDGVVDRWTMEQGNRSCTHFTIGRDPSEGVIQLIPINRNANHAGGPGHGNFVNGSHTWHPNEVSVGIELNCTGAIRLVNEQWRYMEHDVPYGDPVPAANVTVSASNSTVGSYNGQRVRLKQGQWRLVRHEPRGLPIPVEDVIQDPDRPGRGWHTVTDYQYEQLGVLLDALENALNPLPHGCVARSTGEVPPDYANFPDGRVVGHVSLEPESRGDPWPPTCDWLRAR